MFLGKYFDLISHENIFIGGWEFKFFELKKQV